MSFTPASPLNPATPTPTGQLPPPNNNGPSNAPTATGSAPATAGSFNSATASNFEFLTQITSALRRDFPVSSRLDREPKPRKPPQPPFSDDMRDLQARGKDPYEYTRQGEPFYTQRLDSIHSATLLRVRRGPSRFTPTASAAGQPSQPPGPAAAPVSQPQPQPSPHAPSNRPSNVYPWSYARQLDPRHMPGEAPLDRFSMLERRRQAALVLDNPEMLMMYAQSMNDSIPSVRMTFTRILCGLDSQTLDAPAAVADRTAMIEEELLLAPSAHVAMHQGKRRQSNNGGRPAHRRDWR